uniref:HDC01568 n=1 Tax=Drosophila melanogaster TaxID=7227 RepID=Q6IHQ7_DROME|nr:TPA_inf: HDC01568 [Drosophila melanogaster]
MAEEANAVAYLRAFQSGNNTETQEVGLSWSRAGRQRQRPRTAVCQKVNGRGVDRDRESGIGTRDWGSGF